METANILTSKGTTTIPKTIRDELGLKPGNRVRFAKNKQGAYVIEKELTLEDVRKMNTKYVKKVVKRLSKEEIQEGMAAQAVERYKRAIK